MINYVYNVDGSRGTVKATGSASGNIATFHDNKAQLENSAAGYALTVNGRASIYFSGHEGDTANFFDSSMGNDAFYAWASHPNFGDQPVAEMSGSGCADYAIGFGANTAQSRGGSHAAYFYTAAYEGLPGGDTFLSWENQPNFGQPAAEMCGTYGTGSYTTWPSDSIATKGFRPAASARRFFTPCARLPWPPAGGPLDFPGKAARIMRRSSAPSPRSIKASATRFGSAPLTITSRVWAPGELLICYNREMERHAARQVNCRDWTNDEDSFAKDQGILRHQEEATRRLAGKDQQPPWSPSKSDREPPWQRRDGDCGV